MSNATVWFLWKKTGIPGSGLRGLTTDRLVLLNCLLGDVGEGYQSTRPSAGSLPAWPTLPCLSPSTENSTLVWGAGEARGCAPEKLLFKRCRFSPFDVGLLSRLADKKGKPYVGSQPPVLPGWVLAGLLWAARSCPVALLCFLVDAGGERGQNPGERAGRALERVASACLHEGPGAIQGGPVCAQPTAGRARSRWLVGGGGVSGSEPEALPLGVRREI